MEIKRDALVFLDRWLNQPRRKPLVIRGARQVGKSTLVEQFAAARGLSLCEIDLERHRGLKGVFASLDADRICEELSVLAGRAVDAPGTLLFLDEIQAVPEAIEALRYLRQDRPSLPVVAAGSLLEFALDKARLSMPVGRITYLFLGPLSFPEFLGAVEPDLRAWLERFADTGELPATAHEKLLRRARQFCFVGGMPEAVAAYADGGSLPAASEVQRDILQTYEDDFAKYAGGRDLALMQEIFRRLPAVACRKVKYVNFSREARAREVKGILSLFRKARVCQAVESTDASGVPLFAGADPDVWKPLFLDVGLANHACGVDWRMLEALDATRFVNEGAIAEQFVGQELLYADGGFEEPRLAYWLREGAKSNAEVDYLLASGPEIFPVEVKAGKSGTLRSLRQFVLAKSPRTAFRLDANPPGRQTVSFSETGRDFSHELVSLPFYAARFLPRFCERERRDVRP